MISGAPQARRGRGFSFSALKKDEKGNRRHVFCQLPDLFPCSLSKNVSCNSSLAKIKILFECIYCYHLKCLIPKSLVCIRWRLDVTNFIGREWYPFGEVELLRSCAPYWIVFCIWELGLRPFGCQHVSWNLPAQRWQLLMGWWSWKNKSNHDIGLQGNVPP